MARSQWMQGLALAVTLACTSACGDDAPGPDGDTDTLELLGSYVDGFMGTHVVTADTWTQGGDQVGTLVFHIETFDNEANFLIAQNDANNDFNPDLWSRFDWQQSAAQLYFCQSIFNAASAEAAEMASPASTDLMTGCGGFPWSALNTQ